MQRRYILFLMTALSLSACDSYHGPVHVINLGLHPDSATGAMIVNAHDNIGDIARRYRLPIREIIDLNHLEPPYRLAQGQRLKLPAPVDYRVKQGDTPQAVASMFAVSASRLVAVNNIQAPYRLKPGQNLRIPEAYREEDNNAPVVVQDTAPAAAMPVVPPTERVVENDLPAPVNQTRALDSARDDKRVSEPVQQQIVLHAPSSFAWPIRGRVVSGYGPKDDGLYNDGINIAAPRGTPVASAADGVIAYVGSDLKSYGNLVLIRHGGGTMTAYAHLASTSARKGMAVRRGQVIGTVGATGAVTSTQLHFEIRHGSKTVDPRQYLG